MRSLIPAVFLPVALFAGCSDVSDPDEPNEEEVITTVVLTLTQGDETIEVSWADPEDDGSPVIDTLTLAADTEYDVSVQFLNELEDPAEDITLEVEDESDEHQVFYTGSAVDDGLVTVSYDDTDADGLPVGLLTVFDTAAAGSGELVLTLQHLPPVDDAPVKVGGLADDAATNGVDALPGDADAHVVFPLLVE